MVLKKLLIIISYILIFSINGYSNESDFWKQFFKIAFDNNKNVLDLKLEYNSVLINKKQYDYQWFPKLQVGIQETNTFTRGDAISILNQTSNSELTQIISPSLYFSINQKLPGLGSFNLSTQYGFNYLPDRNVYLQYPQIDLTFQQYLGNGAFGIKGNIENKLIDEQLKYSYLIYNKNLTQQLYEIIILLQNKDTINAQENYYSALVCEYESELKTAKEKESLGIQSNLESHYLNHQYIEAFNKLNEIKTENKQILNELLLLYSDFNQDELEKERLQLKEIINNIYMEVNNQIESLTTNIDNEILKSVLNQYFFQFLNEENNYTPLFYVSSSFGINEYLNTSYSDWFKSFRILKEINYPFNYSISIGIQKTFEIPKAKKLRNEVYELNKKSIENEIVFYQKSMEKEFALLKNQIDFDILYLNKLEKEIPIENDFRQKRKILFEQNVITQDEFLKSETQYFLIMNEFVSTFWKIIKNQIQVIIMCSKNNILINNFLGENYEKNF